MLCQRKQAYRITNFCAAEIKNNVSAEQNFPNNVKCCVDVENSLLFAVHGSEDLVLMVSLQSKGRVGVLEAKYICQIGAL